MKAPLPCLRRPIGVQESMRLHPAVNPMFLSCRVATADAVLGGYRIPKGTGVIMNSMAMAMDPKLFPDPEARLVHQPPTREVAT